MSETFREYRHPEAGFTVPVPARWEIDDQVEGCALVAVDPTRDDDQFASNVVVTVERLADGDSLDVWLERSRKALRASLNRVTVLDEEVTQLCGRPVWRTLSHYLHDPHGGVNLEQWALTSGRWGYVMSFSTSALSYDAMADVMSHVAHGFRIEQGPAEGGAAEEIV